MHWIVIKTGADMFDALHACGLALLIANGSDAETRITNCGTHYLVYCPSVTIAHTASDLLDRVLAVPEQIQLEAKANQKDVPFSNLDGLLAALFTVPGIRAVSIADTLLKMKANELAGEKARIKVRGVIKVWHQFIERNNKQSADWLLDVLEDYRPDAPKIPVITLKKNGLLSLTMPLDPAFSLSSNRWVSDGKVFDRCNVSIDRCRYGVLLAYIGAARFLRAQRVSGSFVNFYVPIPGEVTVTESSSMPCLYTMESPPHQAYLYHWLKLGLEGNQWKALAYQTLQIQGAQQSISVGRGTIPFDWLHSLQNACGTGIIQFWLSLLRPVSQNQLEIADLLDVLARNSLSAWLNHLLYLAVSTQNSRFPTRCYTYHEVSVMTKIMNRDHPPKLATLLTQEYGTLRFGRALRLLGRQRPTDLKDTLYDLQAVQTVDQLMLVLANALQLCEMAKARSDFILIPDELDLEELLGHVNQFGVRTVAASLIILSALRYPKTDDQSDAGEERGGESEHG